MRKIERCLLFFILLANSVLAQQGDFAFVPPVFNYLPSDYRGGTQNWGLSEDSKGQIYVANNKGLLVYDGKKWEINYLPRHKIVRSVFVENTNGIDRIYVGSFEEFGFFEYDKTNRLQYTSLKNKVKGYAFQNDEVWTIVKHDNKIYFQTFGSYFEFDGKEVRVHTPRPAPFGMFSTKKGLYFQGIDSDFFKLENNDLAVQVKREDLGNDNVVGVVEQGQNLILVTAKSGLYEFNTQSKKLNSLFTNLDDIFAKNVVNRVLFTKDSLLILGMLNDGVFAISKKGKEQWHINKNKGLNNNTVLGLLEDSQQNLWAALDNGVAQIQKKVKLSYLYLSSDIELIEDMEFFQSKLFLATNKGVFVLDTINSKMEKLPNFNDQVWFVKNFDKQLFIGHNAGTSVLIDNKIKSLDNVGVGGMDIKKGVIHGEEVLIESSYTFLTIYKKDEAGEWYPSNIIDDFSDLIDRVEIDFAGNIWANHVHKGIYRIELADDLKYIKRKIFYERLSETENDYGTIKLLKLRGKPVFVDGKSFYRFDDDKQEIVPYENLNSELPQLMNTRKIVEINNNLYWFITDKEYYLVTFENGIYRNLDKITFGSIAKPSNEERATVYVSRKGKSYFCLNESLAIYNYNTTVKSNQNQLFLSSITSYNRKNGERNFESVADDLTIDYSKNNLSFEFRYPNFTKHDFKISFFLENYDEHWSVPSTDFTIGYQNLPQGDYKLKTKLYNDLDEEINTVDFSFKIATPWYKSVIAFMVYGVLLVLGSLLFMVFYFKYTIAQQEKKFAEEEKERARQLERQEKEITKLQNEKLESELEHKSKALASATMMNIKKDEFLESLIGEFKTFLDKNKLAWHKGDYIVKHIQNYISKEDEWQMFEENFDMIHKNFFRNLKIKYPNLTPADLKLCVLLRLNYSTKEIASMQGVSVRGVETARYRLRKKLNLMEDVNLNDFLITFE